MLKKNTKTPKKAAKQLKKGKKLESAKPLTKTAALSGSNENPTESVS
jgi:hypothetical protein